MSEVVVANHLKQYISRVERLEIEKAEVLDNLKQVFDEAKANGFDVKTMKQLLKLKKLEKSKLAEQDALIELYRSALDI